jgi:hypothetical protein
MLRSLRYMYAYTVLLLRYIDNRAARGFMHKCINQSQQKPAGGRRLRMEFSDKASEADSAASEQKI